MAAYPTLDQIPYVSYKGSYDQRVLISNFDDMGEEQRKLKWLYQKKNISLAYSNITNANLRILQNFYTARRGPLGAFNYFFPYSEDHWFEYVGTGDGITTGFNAPGKTMSNITMYEDDYELTQAADATSAGDYYIVEGGGADGADSIIVFVATIASRNLTIDFTGFLKIRCRFEAAMDFSIDRYNLDCGNNLTVDLKGLLNA